MKLIRPKPTVERKPTEEELECIDKTEKMLEGEK